MIDPRFYTAHGPLSIDALIKGLPITVGGSFDSGALISNAAAFSNSVSGDITYVSGRSALKSLSEAGASACLTSPEFETAISDAGMTPLITPNPRAQFAKLLPRLYSVIEPHKGSGLIDEGSDISDCAHIMPGAVIAQNVKIGKRVKIGVGTYIGPGCVIGDDCNIGNAVSIDCAVIGYRVRVGSNTVIGAQGFGVAKDGADNFDIMHLGRVVIDDDVALGSHCAVDRGMFADTKIGKGCKFDNFCHVAHNVTIGSNGMFAGYVGISGSCLIGDNVVMGGQVGLVDHLTIGAGAMLGAGAGVTKNVPAGEVWSGYPAKPLRQYMKEVATLSRLAKPKKKS